MDRTFEDFDRSGGRLPPYQSAAAAFVSALGALEPPSRMTVSEAAERRMVRDAGRWVPWSNGFAPYLREPQDMTASRRFRAVVLVGPARSAKTEGLILNPIAHAILAAPRTAHVCHIGQNSAREFSIEKLGAMVANSPELDARRLPGRSADNTFDKRFAAGARVTVGWPVVKQLSARDIPLVLFADYDRVADADDLEGEGEMFALGRKRTQSFRSLGMTVAESSPGRDVTDESWTPASPHEAPPVPGGILSLYNRGTRARWHWPCRECGLEFEPAFDRVVTPERGTPQERGAAAFVACPHCGGVHEGRHKRDMNAAGRWLHETAEGGVAPLGPETRPSAIASYWLTGAAAALASLEEIVTRRLEALEAFEATGGEGPLRAAVNLDWGEAYLPRSRGASAALSEASIRETAAAHAWQAAPAWARFVTIAVDVQPGRFVVGVEAWGPGCERMMIDRLDLHAPPASAPRAAERRLDPARYAEDWAALEALAFMSWPVAGGSHRLRACAIGVDVAGESGVWPNAQAFWRGARGKFGGLFHLVRGEGGLRRKRVEKRIPQTSRKGKAAARASAPILFVGVDLLKDEIAASLTRRDHGARALHVPAGAPREVFAELASERRGESGWEKRPGVKRNEALDLAVYNLALGIFIGAEAVDFERAPAWAAAGPGNSFAVAAEGAAADPAEPGRPAAGRRRRPGAARRFQGW